MRNENARIDVPMSWSVTSPRSWRSSSPRNDADITSVRSRETRTCHVQCRDGVIASLLQFSSNRTRRARRSRTCRSRRSRRTATSRRRTRSRRTSRTSNRPATRRRSPTRPSTRSASGACCSPRRRRTSWSGASVSSVTWARPSASIWRPSYGSRLPRWRSGSRITGTRRRGRRASGSRLAAAVARRDGSPCRCWWGTANLASRSWWNRRRIPVAARSTCHTCTRSTGGRNADAAPPERPPEWYPR